ncbi:DUF1203 domain-containing protein [Oryzicola mucosus]|uniref:DUF1203 domain-containing protein n=1 Tax=Oryzicola mucosus TaxID=2767425 RepID=A0A8J6PGX9_9HYPH|nr:DUF1203 domain-containing protein [Oryzicola mucosus]MBD0415024.1 DUF1203 domain-containing protein [Oryzicola mucosus]
MSVLFKAIPTEYAKAIWAGGDDAYGMQPERRVSDGDGVPCRHCLRDVREGESYLLFAYRPFTKLQAFAETGPIFLHADECGHAGDAEEIPEIMQGTPDFIIRGYSCDDRIVYGTGGVVATKEVPARAGALLNRDDVAYVHVRSARNNCYQCRIEPR